MKIYIALKETAETLFWLDLLHETDYLRAYPKTFSVSHEESPTTINHADLLDATHLAKEIFLPRGFVRC